MLSIMLVLLFLNLSVIKSGRDRYCLKLNIDCTQFLATMMNITVSDTTN